MARKRKGGDEPLSIEEQHRLFMERERRGYEKRTGETALPDPYADAAETDEAVEETAADDQPDADEQQEQQGE